MTPGRLPPRWGWLVRGFKRYVKRYLKKHLHAVRISKASSPIPNDGAPVLVVLNHPSWWDPLIGAALTDLWPKYHHYAAIDAEMLKKYKAFSRLGFFGVESDSLRGAANFLRTGEAILTGDHRALWVTAQGEFADVRTRPLKLRAGAEHLAKRLQKGYIVPLAIEIVFWSERTPEVLVQFGEAIPFTQVTDGLIEVKLTQTLDQLNVDAMSRDPERFNVYLSGKVGVGGGYDFFRRSWAWLRGRKFDPGHGGIS